MQKLQTLSQERSLISIWSSGKRGFTLLELLISVAILALLMLATTNIFAKSFGSYQATKKTENTIFDAQFLMNLIAKELRTGTVVSPTSDGSTQSIKFFEHSKSECVQYRFNNQSIEVARTSSGTSFSSCDNGTNLSGFTKASTGTITGSFYSVPSDKMSPGPGKVGRVTMTISIESGTGSPTVLQTTTSLRDYGYIGLQ